MQRVLIYDQILCLSDLCTEQLISLRSSAAQKAKRYIPAVRYTNSNGIVLKSSIYKSVRFLEGFHKDNVKIISIYMLWLVQW